MNFTLVVLLGVLTSAASWWVFIRWTDKKQLRRALNQVIAHLMEVRLFGSEPALVLRAQRDLIVANLRFLRILLLPLLILLLPLGLFFFTRTPTAPHQKLIILGIDGMDPAFVERHWDALPNLKSLKDSGYFGRLRTTAPPQSPVAWSSFITGLDPDQHGIYDFVERDPITKALFSSMSKTEEPKHALPLGPYLLPLSSASVHTLRHGTPFWRKLTDHGVPAIVQRMPINFPPEQAGIALSGMGTPDLIGTLGTFTFFTDDPMEMARDVSGGRIVKAEVVNRRALLRLQGPANPLRKEHAITEAVLTVDVDPSNDSAVIQQVPIKQGEWSRWLKVEFPLIPHVAAAHGIVRLYAKQLHPGLEIYVSPINLDPSEPALPISYPTDWAKHAGHDLGAFSTLGIPEDTSALRQEVLTLPEFREQAELVFREEKKLLEYSLDQYKDGFLFYYFSSVDQNSHVLWGKHEDELLKVYREIDDCIGEVRRKEPAAELMVISDHGFTSFDRAVNLNTWLKQSGFGNDAYAVGLNGLYVDAKVRDGVRDALLAWTDDGKTIVERLIATHPAAENRAVAPDFIVGYARGYRASWQTALGEAPNTLIDDNNDAWIGDHCINPDDVPGVWFSSEKIQPQSPGLTDVTAMILKRYGIM